MGNCIGVVFANHIKTSPDERVDNVLAAMVHDEKIAPGNSPMPFATMLKVPHRVVQQQMTQMSQKVISADGNGDGQRIRLVVNKKQLDLLKGSAGNMQLRHAVLESILRKGKKWKPSLATLPEL